MTTATRPGEVRELVAVEERLLCRGDDLLLLLGVLLGEVCGARIRELELTLGRGRDVLAGGRDRGAHGRGVAGREQGPEDRGHQRAAEVALQVGRARSHADTGHRHRARERVGRRGAGQPDADAHEDQRDGHEPVRCPLAPQEEHADERKAEEGLRQAAA